MGMTTEELIEQLRVFGKYDPDQALAADRIEQLGIEVDDIHKEAMSYLEMWGVALAAKSEAEAKLAMALRALEFISCEDNAEGRHARAILTELAK